MPTFYRASLTNSPTTIDFTSNRDKGKAQREGVESEAEWSGISVYNTEERCRKKAARFGLGSFIAELQVPEDAPLRWGVITKGGHCTMWGKPDQFLNYITSVTPVALPESER